MANKWERGKEMRAQVGEGSAARFGGEETRAQASEADAAREFRHEDEWLHYGHPRMPLSERAKIFLPFDPLRGFRAELARRERLVQERQAAERGEAEEGC